MPYEIMAHSENTYFLKQQFNENTFRNTAKIKSGSGLVAGCAYLVGAESAASHLVRVAVHFRKKKTHRETMEVKENIDPLPPRRRHLDSSLAFLWHPDSSPALRATSVYVWYFFGD